MENLIFNDKNELIDYIRKHKIKFLGSGKDGACYLIDNGMVIKSLNDEYNPSFALQFKDLNIESFVFAKSGVLIDNYINAIFMEYINGIALSEQIPNNQDILILGFQLQNLIEDIKKLSELGILVKDFSSGNIIYTDTGFKIIDTLNYLYLGNYNYKLDNLREIMNRLYDILIGELYLSKKIPSSLWFLGKTDILENPKEYLKELKHKIEEIDQQEIITLNDAKKILIKN